MKAGLLVCPGLIHRMAADRRLAGLVGVMAKLKAAEGTTNSYMLDWLSRLQER